jgi:amidase
MNATQPRDDMPKTAVDIAAAVRARSVSAAEITRRYLKRIEKLEPALHAFQVVRADKALAEAEQLDQRPDLADLPLAGVPVAIKDNFNVAGEPTRLGSAATSSKPVESDDELVRRLRTAGAVVIGKTTMPELAIFGFTESAAFGVTRNPWNRERSPGGSTGGGAAAVAGGMAALALGSDGAGSIRGPSNFCGVFGLKPSRGLLPLMGDATEHWYGLSVTGPIATTVQDAALMLDVLAASHSYRDVRPPTQPLRIALALKPPTFLAKLAPSVATAVSESAAVLRDAGHAVTDADPPYPLTLGNVALRLWMAGVAQDALALDWNALEKRTRTMARLGRRLGPGSRGVLTDWTAKASAWFSDFDVALMPVAAVPSLPAGGFTGRGFVSTALSQIKALPYAVPWNIAGFPAAAVPIGTGPDGVPISVQVVAPAGAEALILSVAA